MAKFKTGEFLDGLKADVEHIIESAEFFRNIDKSKMIYTPSENQWSIVQILEHLNGFTRHYLPIIQKAMTEKVTHKSGWFETGFWGDILTKGIMPKNVYEVKNRTRTHNNFIFPNGLNVEKVVNEFIEQQQEFIKLIDTAKYVNLNDVRVSTLMIKLVKLKLGDLLRYLVAHEQRHMIQARNTLTALGVTTESFPVLLDTKRIAALS